MAKSSSQPSLINAEMKIIGDIESESMVVVEGNIEGNIKCVGLVVSPEGEVNGQIVAEQIEVHGSINGNITGKMVSLQSGARVFGDILYSEMHMSEGVDLDGKCKRFDPNATRAPSEKAESIKKQDDSAKSENVEPLKGDGMSFENPEADKKKKIFG